MNEQRNAIVRKYQQITEDLRQHIMSGRFPAGSRLPPERELATEYDVSRPTITRALNDLAKEGLIRRRIGSGSYISEPAASETRRVFGLLVPGLGHVEIFEPICARIAEQAARIGATLTWGASHSAGNNRIDLVRTAEAYISQKVDGIFLQPLELDPSSEKTNAAVMELLSRKRIPVILLDADFVPFPDRSRFDLVGIDNIRAGWVAADHLIAQGARRVDYLSRPFTAKTAVLRRHGYRMALVDAGIAPDRQWEHSIDPEDVANVRALVDTGAADIVCVSDETAAYLMVSLDKLGVKVPDQVRLIGFDDLKYAHLVRVPLTTLRQPCAAIGELAVDAMLGRIANPDQPAREMFLEAELVVRESSMRMSHKA